MGLKDLIVTPIYLILFTFLAYWIRPWVTNKDTRKYFLPALWVRFAGAIALGLIYQFYYGGGDTFNYWEHGSRWIYKAFQDDLSIGLKLLISEGGYRFYDDTYKYSSHIWYYGDKYSYVIVRLASFFDLLTFHTYSATALFFAVFSFSGLWAMYSAVASKYPTNIRLFAIATLFIPSVIFWGSGILKDTITLGAIGWITWALLRSIHWGRIGIREALVFAISFYLVYSIKKYIIICYIPMVAIWIFFKNLEKVKNLALKILVFPILLMILGLSGFFALQQVSAGDDKYALSDLAERARITAYDIRYGWGARTAGDGGYDIGLPDGTWQSMIKLMPAAINVSLFRPYLWEVKNPLMLLAAIESIIILVLSINMIVKARIRYILNDPFLVFCLGFSLMFAFAVGIATFNFGTLMRYKIPMLPFYFLVVLNDYQKEGK